MFFNRRPPPDKPFTLPADPDAPWQSEARGELAPIRRAVLVVRPKEPFLKWLRSLGCGGDTIAAARADDCGVYLIPSICWTNPRSGDCYEDPEAAGFIEEYWRHFFAQALEGWALDPGAWPRPRSLAMFRQWFRTEVHEMVIDLGNFAEG